MRKLLGPLLLVVLIAGVGYAIYRSATQALHERAVVTVRGLSGSEKIDYLTDPKVVSRLRSLGVALVVEKSGSREMAFRGDLSKYDFAFPAGAPAATKVMEVAKVKKSYTPFFTPMAVASWKPIVDVLAANGIVEQLTLLDAKMKEVLVSVHENDTQALLVNGRFLQERFGATTAFTVAS